MTDQQQWTTSDALMSSKSVEHYTPTYILERVAAVLHGIDLDPCADPAKTVPASTHYTAHENGLMQPWEGTVYMNPPYGRQIVQWVERLTQLYPDPVTAALAFVPATPT